MVNFFIVGAQRSATTWLYSALAQSDEVCMLKPLFPEVKYFLKPIDAINPKEYLSLFKPAAEQFIFGNKATSYLDSPETACKIKKTFPSAKIIICLRDPVERALSNYFFSYSHGLESRTLEEVFLKEVPPPHINLNNFSSNPFCYLERGLYSLYLPHYCNLFSPDQVLITFYENFLSSDVEFLKIVDFIGASSPRFPPPIDRLNESPRIQQVSNDIILKLQKYYQRDREILTRDYNLDIPYIYT